MLLDLKYLLLLILEVFDVLLVLLLQRVHLLVLFLESAYLLNECGIADTAVPLLITAGIGGLD